jgi:hypothetical protein
LLRQDINCEKLSWKKRFRSYIEVRVYRLYEVDVIDPKKLKKRLKRARDSINAAPTLLQNHYA